MLLLALVIVAWLAKSALTSYGLVGKSPAPDPNAATPGATPADPRERARAVEQTVIEQARETARRIEDAEKGQ
ncbi:hypothetical protein BURK1_01358 [Burkholderiales bacterium]|nr:hypothetical protein BURK1_01358 [Burkholderiales bacterium]